MASPTTLITFNKCIKSLDLMHKLISKDEESCKRFKIIVETVALLLDALNVGNDSEVRELATKLKDEAREFNDEETNLKLKENAKTFGTAVASIKKSDYTEFQSLLKEKLGDGLMFWSSTIRKEQLSRMFEEFKQKVKEGSISEDEILQQALALYNAGVQDASFWIAGAYYNKKNYNESFKFYKIAADQGFIFAYFRLGLHYRNGYGVSKDINKAIEWLKKTIDCDEKYTEDCVVIMLSEPALASEGFKIIKSYADKTGIGSANIIVAYCYADGVGVDINMALAESYLSKANREDNENLYDVVKRTISNYKERNSRPTPPPNPAPQPRPEQKPVSQPSPKQNKKSSGSASNDSGGYMGCLVLLIIMAVLWAGYHFWYKDYKAEKDAVVRCVYATNLLLRSTPDSELENNVLSLIPYGSKVKVYSDEDGWSYVKIDGNEGYVASNYLLDTDDFELIDALWGSYDSSDVVAASKDRLAILDYLKRNDMYTGKYDWQLYTNSKDSKTNTVMFKDLKDGYDYFPEFIFVLKDHVSGSRRAVVYSFDENQTPIFRYDEDVSLYGDIKSVKYDAGTNKYKIRLTDYNPYGKSSRKRNKKIIESTSSNVEQPNTPHVSEEGGTSHSEAHEKAESAHSEAGGDSRSGTEHVNNM